jgi:hypothetical protein
VAVIAKWGRSANAALRLGFEDATGYSPTVIQRVRSLLEATRDDRLRPPAPVVADTNFPRPRPASALWPLLAAPIVISDAPQPLRRLSTLAREWEEPLVAYAAPALPRAYWTGKVEVHADDALAEPMLRAARGELAVVPPDAQRTVEQREPAAVDRRGAASRSSAAATGPVAATVELGPNRLTARVDAPAAGWLIVLDPWFPGWTATVDGAPARLVRANFAFMAVPVDAGRHEVALTYRNAQVARGALVGALALAALLAAVGWRRRGGWPVTAA